MTRSPVCVRSAADARGHGVTCGRVRRGAYDADGRAELLFQPGDGLAGGDSDDGLFRAHCSTDFSNNGLVLVGLYGKEQDVGVFGDGDVVGASVNAEFFGCGGGVFRRCIGTVYFTRRNSTLAIIPLIMLWPYFRIR